MSVSWKVSFEGSREAVEGALAAYERSDHNDEIALAGSEVDAARPDLWALEAWLPREPTDADLAMLSSLFERSPGTPAIEPVADEDWVTLSQQNVHPIHAGAFAVRTPDHPPDGSARYEFVIPAAQAFGTGQHATTAGCLEILTAMRARGLVARQVIDVGTGTGLLAFATARLWPAAFVTASDIDPVCGPVLTTNAALNGIALNPGRGAVLPRIAAGLDDPLLRARAPYDLLLANILARPLIELAPEFARAVVPGGSVILAGLLESQEGEVRRMYRRVGFRLAHRLVRSEWSILWLRRRRV